MVLIKAFEKLEKQFPVHCLKSLLYFFDVKTVLFWCKNCHFPLNTCLFFTLYLKRITITHSTNHNRPTADKMLKLKRNFKIYSITYTCVCWYGITKFHSRIMFKMFKNITSRSFHYPCYIKTGFSFSKSSFL